MTGSLQQVPVLFPPSTCDTFLFLFSKIQINVSAKVTAFSWFPSEMFMKASIFFYTSCTIVVLLFTSLINCSTVNTDLYTGKLAKNGQFPFAIRLYSKLRDSTVTYCTAAIITNRKLLTAGHCCSIPALRFVVTGDPDQTDFVYSSNRNKYTVYPVQKAVIHPKFERTKDKLVYDLCVLTLRRPMSLKDGHKTIEISYEEFTGQKNCTALGWGTNFGYQIQHKLYYKEALAYRCNLRFGNSSKYWFVCLEPHTVCPGDSGGPLVCDGKLYGIASFFIGHGDESDPRCEEGVVDYYSQLSSEKVFIEKNHSVALLRPMFILYILMFSLVYHNLVLC